MKAVNYNARMEWKSNPGQTFVEKMKSDAPVNLPALSLQGKSVPGALSFAGPLESKG